MADADASELTRRWRVALGGPFMLAYRAVWIALFGAGLVTTAYLTPRDEVAFQSAYVAGSALGLWIFTSESAEGQLVTPLGDEGRRLGYSFLDLLTTVDGRPVPADQGAQASLLQGQAGTVATLGLRHRDGKSYTVHVARDPQRLNRALAGSGIDYAVKRWTQFGFNAVAYIAMLAAAALLFVRRPRDPIAQILSFSLVLGIPDFGELLPIARFAVHLVNASSSILLTAALLLFPDGRLNTRWHWLAIVLFVASSAWSVASFWLSTFNETEFLVTVLPFGAMVMAVVAQYRRTPEGTVRQQAKFVLFGIVVYCIATAIAIVLEPIGSLETLGVGAGMWISLVKNILGALALAALPAGLFVSLFRYRLYDAESTISRSVVFGTLALALLGIFAGAEKMIEILGEHYFGERLGALASGLGAGFAALMMVPLHHRITHWAEHRFQGNIVHLRSALPVLAADMGATATPERLADAVLARVERGVRASHGSVVVGHDILAVRDVDRAVVQAWLSAEQVPIDNQSQLHCDRADPLFQMRVPLYADSVGLAGWMLLGPRPDGSFYGKDERDTLLAIAEPVARALAVARQREVDAVERRREIGRLATQHGLLATRLTLLETRLNGEAPIAA